MLVDGRPGQIDAETRIDGRRAGGQQGLQDLLAGLGGVVRVLPVVTHLILARDLGHGFGGDAVEAGEVPETDVAALLAALVEDRDQIALPLLMGRQHILPVGQLRQGVDRAEEEAQGDPLTTIVLGDLVQGRQGPGGILGNGRGVPLVDDLVEGEGRAPLIRHDDLQALVGFMAAAGQDRQALPGVGAKEDLPGLHRLGPGGGALEVEQEALDGIEIRGGDQLFGEITVTPLQAEQPAIVQAPDHHPGPVEIAGVAQHVYGVLQGGATDGQVEYPLVRELGQFRG